MSEISGIGNNCGNCKRREQSIVTNPTCTKCWNIELEENKKFTQWEAR